MDEEVTLNTETCECEDSQFFWFISQAYCDWRLAYNWQFQIGESRESHTLSFNEAFYNINLVTDNYIQDL